MKYLRQSDHQKRAGYKSPPVICLFMANSFRLCFRRAGRSNLGLISVQFGRIDDTIEELEAIVFFVNRTNREQGRLGKAEDSKF